MRFIERDVIGSDAVISTAFGDRRVQFADYTASGRALQSFENYLICQFEKVNRTSGGRKWKVNLKDGVLHSNGKDYVFTKATGEWSWT